MKVVQNLKLSFFLGIWQRMIKISSFLLVNFVAEIKRLSTWKKLSTTRSRIKHSCPCTHRGAGPPQAIPHRRLLARRRTAEHTLPTGRLVSREGGKQGHTYPVSSSKLPNQFKSILLGSELKPCVLRKEFSQREKKQWREENGSIF